MLSQSFNACVLTMASRLFPCGYDIASDAPDTLEKLTAHIAETGRMCVWNGASDTTIFGDNEVNFASRAWHDFHHWKGQHGFTREGEHACMIAQQNDIRAIYGAGEQTELFCLFVECEVMGQFEYFEKNGEFPADQISFARDWLNARGVNL